MKFVTKIKEFEFPKTINLECCLVVLSFLLLPVVFIDTILGEYLQIIMWLTNVFIHWIQWNRSKFVINAMLMGISMLFFIESFIMIFVKL